MPPTDEAGPDRPVAFRLVSIVAVLLSVVVLAVSVGGFVVVTWFNGSVSRVDLKLGAAARPPAPPAGTANWLLVGTDSRAGSSGEFGSVDGQRSDTTILAHLDADGTTTMVSFPRDVLVTIPAYTSSDKKHFPQHKDKFTNAILEGGPALLVRTIQAMTGMRIDHYVSVNLEGFKQISEAVGGVSVCILHSDYKEIQPDGGVITNVNDGFSGFHGRDGAQTVIGDQAVAFVRQRHGLIGSDLARIKRQQQFLGSVFRAATRSGVLLNPVAITRLLQALHDALTLDKHTSFTDLEKLAVRLRGVGTSQLLFETVPQRDLSYSDTNLGNVFFKDNVLQLTPTGQTTSVGSVQIVQQAQFDQLISSLKNESPTTATPGAKVSPGAAASPGPSARAVRVTVPPEQVQVTVQDGVGRAGLASEVTAQLTREGYRTGAPGPAGSTGYATSVVLYGPDKRESAQTVAAAVPGSVLRQDPAAGNGIVLIVGANYTTVNPVSMSAPVTPTATPTPRASISPAPKPASADSASNRCTY